MDCRKPLFSIVMPVYNAQRYIGRAIADVQAQTVGDWELIIVDDASPDESAAIAAARAGEDERIRIVSHAVNKGASAARNSGIDAARGLYLWFADPDDGFAPDLLESCARALAENPAAITVFGLVEVILDERGTIARECEVRVPEARCTTADEVRSQILPLECSTLLGYSANKVYDVDFVRRTGVRWADEAIIEDYFFNIGLFAQAPSLNVLSSMPYRYYRRTSASLTATSFIAEYYPLHRMRIAIMRDRLSEWGLLDNEAKSRLGARYARYILSATERTFDQRSGMREKERGAWLESVFQDELFCELVPFARADDAVSNAFLVPLKRRWAPAVLALGRVAHTVRTRGNVAFRLAVKRK